MNTLRDLFDYQPERNWRLRALSHHATLLLGKHFHSAIPLVFVTGYPKSGTTWVCQIVADYLHLPFPRYSILPIGCPAVIHGHYGLSRRFRRAVYVMRDGRDVFVSKYFHLIQWLNIPAGDHPRMSRSQKFVFPRMTNRDAIAENLPAFIERQMHRPSFVRMNWSQHINSYYDCQHDGVVALRYEDLRSEPENALADAMRRLVGVEPEANQIRAALDRFSFIRQAGRIAGVEDRESLLRMGQVGDWRNHFSREAAEVFDRLCGDALIMAGYESDRSWVDRIEST